jgi:hypothetical protein
MENALKKKWIKEIALGPRQILFGPDMGDTHLTGLLLSTIEKQCRLYGQADLHDTVTDVTTQNKLPEREIVQIIFGLVHELKLCFYHGNRHIPASDVKKKLLNNPETTIKVVLNRKVPVSKFQAVQQIFQLIRPQISLHEDQHEFAFAGLQIITQWHNDLKTWYAKAKTMSYPGTDHMAALLAFTGSLLQNQTAHTLLTAWFDQKDQLVAAAQDVEKIRTFYTMDMAFWDQLVQAMPQFTRNLPHIKTHPDIAAAFNELVDIFSSPYPFDRIITARDLFKTVSAFHQQVEAQKLDACRQQAKERLKEVIHKLSANLESHNVTADTRNRILLALRQTQKKINGLPDIDQVNQTCRDAIDLAMDHVDEVI